VASTVPVVERRYLDEPDACMRAVELLLKKHRKKGTALGSRPDDAKGRSKNDSSARTIIPDR